MPPLHDESDSHSPTSSMSQLFNNILSSSITMCNDNVIGTSSLCNIKEEYQPSTTTNKETISTAAAIKKLEIVRARRKASLLSSSGTTTASSNDPRRPPLNPKTKSKSNRNRRKKAGLSVDTSLPTSGVHSVPKPERQDAPPLISCSRIVELRRKSLGDKHFFRPVSFEEDSVGKQ